MESRKRRRRRKKRTVSESRARLSAPMLPACSSADALRCGSFASVRSRSLSRDLFKHFIRWASRTLTGMIFDEVGRGGSSSESASRSTIPHEGKITRSSASNCSKIADSCGTRRCCEGELLLLAVAGPGGSSSVSTSELTVSSSSSSSS